MEAIEELHSLGQGIATLKIWALPELHHRFSTATAETDGYLERELWLWL